MEYRHSPAWRDRQGRWRAGSRCPASHYIRGIERIKIFKDDTDRKEWLEKYSSVSSAIERMKVRIKELSQKFDKSQEQI